MSAIVGAVLMLLGLLGLIQSASWAYDLDLRIPTFLVGGILLLTGFIMLTRC